jgi:hypothetical protein
MTGESAFVEIPEDDPADKPVLELPLGDDDLIDGGQAAIARYGADPLSERLGELIECMAEASTPGEAVAAAEEVLAIYRRLAGVTSTALGELATALTGVGSSLSEVSWQLALAPADQAVAMYRDLVEAGFSPPPDLSNSLSKLLVFLSEMSTCVTAGLPVREELVLR